MPLKRREMQYPSDEKSEALMPQGFGITAPTPFKLIMKVQSSLSTAWLMAFDSTSSPHHVC